MQVFQVPALPRGALDEPRPYKEMGTLLTAAPTHAELATGTLCHPDFTVAG